MAQCHHGLAHGVLLTLRYLVESMDWEKTCSAKCNAGRLKGSMTELIAILHRVARLTLAILSTPQVGNMDSQTTLPVSVAKRMLQFQFSRVLSQIILGEV